MDLLQNPFHILTASTRDDKRRLLELAEQCALTGDPEAVSRARTTLSHPRKRLEAELGWFPGLAPRQAAECVAMLTVNPAKALSAEGLPALAQANLLAAAIARLSSDHRLEGWPGLVGRLDAAFDSIDPQSLLGFVNDDRAVAGIQEVSDASWIEEGLAERRVHFKNVLKTALDRLRSADLVEVMTRVAEGKPSEPAEQARSLTLIDDLVDTYEVEAHRFLDAEAANVEALAGAIRKSLEGAQPRTVIERLLDRFEAVVRNWDCVAQPIQLSARRRGRDHDISHRVGFTVRSLAIDIYNKHDLLEDSARLTRLLQELFAEVPQVAEFTAKDAEALDDLKEQKSGESRRKWEEAIRYRGVVIGLFNEPLEISAEGIDWKGQRWPLDAITRVRWGGTRRRENGTVKLSFSITFGTDTEFAQIVTSDAQLFEAATDKLWRAVGVRLMIDMLKRVRAGESVSFGDIKVTDLGAELPRRLGGGLRERVFVSWYDLHRFSRDGEMHLVDKNNKDTVFASISYQSDDNTHILDSALERFWKSSAPRLSSLLSE